MNYFFFGVLKVSGTAVSGQSADWRLSACNSFISGIMRAMAPVPNSFMTNAMAGMKVNPVKTIAAYAALAVNVYTAPDEEKALWMSMSRCIHNNVFGALSHIRDMVNDHSVKSRERAEAIIAENYLNSPDIIDTSDLRKATEKYAESIPGNRCAPYIQEIVEVSDLQNVYAIMKMFSQLVKLPGEKSVFCESYPSYVLSNVQLRVHTGVHTTVLIDGRSRPWMGTMPTFAAVAKRSYTAVWNGIMEYMVWTGTYRNYDQIEQRLAHRASLIQRSMSCSEDVYRTLLFTLKDWGRISTISQDILAMCAAFMQHEVEVFKWPHVDKTLYCEDLFNYAVQALQYSMDITVLGASPSSKPKMLGKK